MFSVLFNALTNNVACQLHRWLYKIFAVAETSLKNLQHGIDKPLSCIVYMAGKLEREAKAGLSPLVPKRVGNIKKIGLISLIEGFQ